MEVLPELEFRYKPVLRNIKAGSDSGAGFAAGTSSRSTKLVHGGLRYLKQFDVELVADVTQTSSIGKNVPHVVQPSYMLMPIYDEPGASFNEFSPEVVLHLYDYLAKVDDEWSHYMIDKDKMRSRRTRYKNRRIIGRWVLP